MTGSAAVVIADASPNISKAVKYEPYTTLKRDKLIGLYGFDEDGSNVIPLHDYGIDRCARSSNNS